LNSSEERGRMRHQRHAAADTGFASLMFFAAPGESIGS